MGEVSGLCAARATISLERPVADAVDQLGHAGRRLTHRWAQQLGFDTEGRIGSIRHVDPPGEADQGLQVL